MARFIQNIIEIFAANDITTLDHLKGQNYEDMLFGEKVPGGRKTSSEQSLRSMVEKLDQHQWRALRQCLSKGRCRRIWKGGWLFCQLACLQGSCVVDRRMQEVVLCMLGKPKPAVVHVDMAKRLKDLGLSEFFPDTLWPPTAAVRELASKLKALKKLGQENAFVSVDLKKCAVWFSEVLLRVMFVRRGSCRRSVLNSRGWIWEMRMTVQRQRRQIIEGWISATGRWLGIGMRSLLLCLSSSLSAKQCNTKL